MDPSRGCRPWRWLGVGVGLAGAAYAAYAGVAWYRYGARKPPHPAELDALLDRFMPVYEVAERHHIRVAAPAAVTLAAAADLDLFGAPIVRNIIRAREIVLGASPGERPQSKGLMADATALGWGVLATIPGRQIVMGAVTRPWEPEVSFRAVPPDEFATFSEPGYVKIAWTLRADETGPTTSVFRTETRVIATDARARRRFRRYWAFVSPGIRAIRWAVLLPVKRAAERRSGTDRRPTYARRRHERTPVGKPGL